jgi:hypothetical protein
MWGKVIPGRGNGKYKGPEVALGVFEEQQGGWCGWEGVCQRREEKRGGQDVMRSNKAEPLGDYKHCGFGRCRLHRGRWELAQIFTGPCTCMWRREDQGGSTQHSAGRYGYQDMWAAEKQARADAFWLSLKTDAVLCIFVSPQIHMLKP